MIRFVEDANEREAIASTLLSGLPEWFGLPESTQNYVKGSRSLPMWTYERGGVPVGFIVLRETSAVTVEIWVMGVRKEAQHSGVGTSLWQECLRYARQKRYAYAQVKTVQMGRYPEYDATNRFYQHLGFQEFECFPTLWDEWNPCQIYVQAIGPTAVSDQ
jgi:ribosomal protein S18 acetylase RimI-like enzyme